MRKNQLAYTFINPALKEIHDVVIPDLYDTMEQEWRKMPDKAKVAVADAQSQLYSLRTAIRRADFEAARHVEDSNVYGDNPS